MNEKQFNLVCLPFQASLPQTHGPDIKTEQVPLGFKIQSKPNLLMPNPNRQISNSAPNSGSYNPHLFLNLYNNPTEPQTSSGARQAPGSGGEGHPQLQGQNL